MVPIQAKSTTTMRRMVPYAVRERAFGDGRATIIAAVITVAGHWLVATVLPPLLPPRDLPAGTVLIAYNKVDPSEAYGAGWALCGGAPDTPKLEGLFLVGGNQDNVATTTGAADHQHPVALLSQYGPGGRARRPAEGGIEGADNGDHDNWEHQHMVEGATATAENIPPAYRVLFLCKS